MERILRDLKTLASRNLHRAMERPLGLDLVSNDYLGLAEHAGLRQWLIEDLENGCPLGAAGSRLLSGNTPWHVAAEDELSDWFCGRRTLLFSSGYNANLAVLAALADHDTVAFSDSLNHASLIDGLRLGRAERVVYTHKDMTQLDEGLTRARFGQRKLIVTESLFSMDGDRAPLAEIVELARRHRAWLIVDETHATGVYGPTGRGLLESVDTTGVPFVSIHGAGKALGAAGAFITCDESTRDFLANRARPFVFSTAIQPLLASQIRYASRIIRTEPRLRETLHANIASLRARLHRVSSDASPILSLVTGSNESALAAAAALRERGLHVRAIRSPTVPTGTERLRLTVRARLTQAELEFIAHHVNEVFASA